MARINQSTAEGRQKAEARLRELLPAAKGGEQGAFEEIVGLVHYRLKAIYRRNARPLPAYLHDDLWNRALWGVQLGIKRIDVSKLNVKDTVGRFLAQSAQAKMNEYVTSFHYTRRWTPETGEVFVPRVQTEYIEDLGNPEHSDPFDLPDPNLTIEERLVLDGGAQELLDGLTKKERDVVWLRFVEEQTQTQVAETFGVTPTTVKTWEREGLRKMKARLLGESVSRPTHQYPGVYWHPNTQKWLATIFRGGRKIHLGYFSDPLEAVRVRKEAENDTEIAPKTPRKSRS